MIEVTRPIGCGEVVAALRWEGCKFELGARPPGAGWCSLCVRASLQPLRLPGLSAVFHRIK